MALGRSALAKPRVVVLGSGWGGFAVAKTLQTSLFDVTLVSPRNHMLFTVRNLAGLGGGCFVLLIREPQQYSRSLATGPTHRNR